MKQEEVKDILGNTIKVGDVIFRAKYSSLTIHTVLGITKRSLKLSRKQETRNYRNLRGIERHYNLFVDTYTLESLTEHNCKFYVPINSCHTIKLNSINIKN